MSKSAEAYRLTGDRSRRLRQRGLCRLTGSCELTATEATKGAIENTKAAIGSHLAALREDGVEAAGDAGLLITTVRIAA